MPLKCYAHKIDTTNQWCALILCDFMGTTFKRSAAFNRSRFEGVNIFISLCLP